MGSVMGRKVKILTHSDSEKKRGKSLEFFSPSLARLMVTLTIVSILNIFIRE
jgi:hypothetical protein